MKELRPPYSKGQDRLVLYWSLVSGTLIEDVNHNVINFFIYVSWLEHQFFSGLLKLELGFTFTRYASLNILYWKVSFWFGLNFLNIVSTWIQEIKIIGEIYFYRACWAFISVGINTSVVIIISKWFCLYHNDYMIIIYVQKCLHWKYVFLLLLCLLGSIWFFQFLKWEIIY